MSLFRLLMLGCSLLGMLLGASALTPSQIGTADLIALGTVTSMTVVDGQPQLLQATLTVERLLKGTTPAQTLTFRLPAHIVEYTGIRENNNIATGKPAVVTLVNGQSGYQLAGGTDGIAPAAEADGIAAQVKAIPLQLTLQAPQTPCYFAQTMKMQVTVTNTGATPLQFGEPVLEGYYLSPRMPAQIAFTDMNPRQQMLRGLLRTPEPLQPGATSTASTSVSLPQAAEWQFFPADSYFLTPIAIRTRLTYWPAGNGDYTKRVVTEVASPWVATLTGFAPPIVSAPVTPVAQPQPVPPVDIARYLNGVRPNYRDSAESAAARIAKEGMRNPAVIVAIRTLLMQKQAKLDEVNPNPGDDMAAVLQLNTEIGVLERALELLNQDIPRHPDILIR